MGNANADNLIGRILSEAEETAARIQSDADASCEEIRKDCEKRIAENAAALGKLRDAKVKEILDGAAIRARLDGRKELLGAKRALLDETFALAYTTLCNRPASELSALYEKVLLAEAEADDLVAPAAADRAAVSEAIRRAGKARLSERDASVERGFVLYGKSYEKDCSLRAILSELRDREETKVAEVLFS